MPYPVTTHGDVDLVNIVDFPSPLLLPQPSVPESFELSQNPDFPVGVHRRIPRLMLECAYVEGVVVEVLIEGRLVAVPRYAGHRLVAFHDVEP